MPITVFRCPHDSQALKNGLFEKEFRKSDIIFLEQGIKDGSEDLKMYYSELSEKGQQKHIMEITAFDKYNETIDSFIRNSRKKVEIEKSHLSFEKLLAIEKIHENARRLFYRGDLENACKGMLENSKALSKENRKREHNIVNQLVELQNQNEGKKIIFPFGIDHSIYYKLKKKGLDVKQVFYEKPFVFPIFAEIYRRIEFNKPITMEMLARSIVENAVSAYLTEARTGELDHLFNLKGREIAERLSYEDIKDLSKYISQDSYRSKMPKEATVIWLRKKGFEI